MSRCVRERERECGREEGEREEGRGEGDHRNLRNNTRARTKDADEEPMDNNRWQTECRLELTE